MPTVVDILTFISRINTASNCFKARNIVIFQHFSFMSNWNFILSWVEHEQRFITPGSGLHIDTNVIWLLPHHRYNKNIFNSARNGVFTLYRFMVNFYVLLSLKWLFSHLCCYMTPIKELLWLAETGFLWLWQILMQPVMRVWMGGGGGGGGGLLFSIH